MIAIEQFNELGGVDGKMIEAVVGDVPDTDAAKTEVTRLVQKEGVKVVTGVYGSAFAEQAAAITNRNDALYVEAISITNRLTTQGYDNVFRLHCSATSFGTEVAVIARGLADEYNYEKPKVALVSMNNDFGLGIAESCNAYAEQSNMEIVANIEYSSDTQDATDIVLKLKNADPDIVIATSYINDAILITKKCKELDFMPDIWLGVGSGYGLSDYYDALGEDAEGIIDIDPTNYVDPQNVDPELADLVEDFQVRFKEKQGYDSPTVGYLEWQTMWFLLNDVIKPCGGTDDVEALKETARAVQHDVGYFPTGAGVKFDENGQNQLAILSAMQWQDGKLLPIYPDFIAATEAKDLPLTPWEER
jgi:branched-chain amino acid transport system substrate-binding protein